MMTPGMQSCFKALALQNRHPLVWSQEVTFYHLGTVSTWATERGTSLTHCKLTLTSNIIMILPVSVYSKLQMLQCRKHSSLTFLHANV